MSPVGVLPRPEGGPVDFDRLRVERRERLLEAMKAADVGALLLGRPANVAFASGARPLWTSGTRPFAPACAVVAATGRVHLLSTWDEGVPAEITHAELFGLSWNPALALERLSSVKGLAEVDRVATDGWAASTPALLQALCPTAEVVDAGPVLHHARGSKTPDELACLETAAAAAEAGLAAMVDALRPGVTVAALGGAGLSAVASLGLPCPPTEGVAWAASGGDRPVRVPTDRTVAAGDLVTLQPGAIFGGYEVTVARTRVVPGAPPGPAALEVAQANRTALDAVIAACRPGATGADLVDAWREAGGGDLSEPLAWGLGLGVEAPVMGPAVGLTSVVRSGSVLAVQGATARAGLSVLEQDAVLVGPEGPTLLTRSRPGLGRHS